MTQSEILQAIVAERRSQDAKWGPIEVRGDAPWTDILVEEVGEVSRALLEGTNNLEKELVQVAAVAVAWLETL